MKSLPASESRPLFLYRSVHLLAAAARGQLARSIALEGGMASALWAGARKKGPVLAKHLEAQTGVPPIVLEKVEGETRLARQPLPRKR